MPTIDHIHVYKLDDAVVGRFSDRQQLPTLLQNGKDERIPQLLALCLLVEQAMGKLGQQEVDAR